jgi:DNA-binding SARP family transcriptional activator
MPSGLEEPRDWVEVRVLGPLRVWRADGSTVLDREWRTSKNADLLRWLALHAGDPVPVEALLAGLWPGVDDARARASLRTAVSHLRKVLGPDAVTRDSSDVTLTNAWVDATAFTDLAEEVDWRRRNVFPAEAMAAAREADALYLADLPAGDSAPATIAERSAALRMSHRTLLEHAAELAIELGWMRDAVSYATRLMEADPVSELASRVLMLGHAGMGEQHHALQAYERCRQVLAEELGVDPSPQTQAVHLQVLRPPPSSRPAPVLIGRDNEVEWLRSRLVDATTSTSEEASPRRVILLAGSEGSGRKRLAAEVCQRVGLKLYDVGNRPELLDADEEDTVLLWQPDLSTDLGLVRQLLLDADSVAGRDVVILVVPRPGVDRGLDRLPRGDHSACLELGPLLRADVAELAAHLLGGSVTDDLVDELVSVSGGVPGGVATIVRHWAGAGKLLATAHGLGLAPRTGTESDQAVRKVLARALPRLEGDAYDALLLTAALNRPVTPSLLAALLPDDGGQSRARASAALEKMVDVGLLRFSSAGAVWRHPLMRDSAYGWMRPAVRRRVHLRIAEQAPIPSEARVRHWLAGGERELACLAALEAAERCSARGDHAAARTHLLEVCSLGDLPESSAADRVDLFERLGDACALVRRPDEARSAYSRALDIARGQGMPGDTARLARKVEAAANPRALDQSPPHRVPGAPASAGPVVVNGYGPDASLEATLTQAVALADQEGSHEARVQARLQLAGAVHLPRRQFSALDHRVDEALGLARSAADTVGAVLLRQTPTVLLGGARGVGDALEDASATAEGAGEELSWWRLLGLRILVAHDLGAPVFERLWPQLRDRVTTGPVDPIVPELATIGLRVMVERGLLDTAAAMAQHLSFAGGQPTTLLEHLSRLSLAELAEANAEPRRAAELLRSVIEEGTATGCTLLVPEAAARFVRLEAAHDLAGAHAALEIHRRLLSTGVGGPREEVWGGLAHGAVLAAQGDVRGAADACAAAAALAHQHELEFLALRARHLHLSHLHATLPRQAGAADESFSITTS